MPYLFALLSLWTFLVLTPSNGVLADDPAPLLVRQLETEIGGTRETPRVGGNGAVYALILEEEEAGAQSLQIATDALNRPVLVRVAQVIQSTPAAKAFVRSSGLLVDLARNAPLEMVETQMQRLAEEIIAFSQSPATRSIELPLSDGSPMLLALTADTKVALFDVAVTRPEPSAMAQMDIADRISDSTTVSRLGTVYHAPNGRTAEILPNGQFLNGSWRTDEENRYCVERPPKAGFSCYELLLETDNRLIQAQVGQKLGGAYSTDLLNGNPEGLQVAVRGDAITASVAKRLITGKTERRANADGMIRELFYDQNGMFRGVSKGTPLSGRWSILSDGRLCLQFTASQQFECAFLSETDGGTFRHLTETQTLLGEALYTLGNVSHY